MYRAILPKCSIEWPRYLLPLACATALMLPVAPIIGAGLTGRTYVRESNGGIGSTIANVRLFFVKEDGTSAIKAISDANGHYSVKLNPGRYYVLATHRDYEDYTSAPGFSVVSGNAQRTANFFLRKPVITTVLIVRHAEKQNPDGNEESEPLSDLGLRRARRLGVNLLRAGISAVYSTKNGDIEIVRTRETVKPLAAKFRLPIQLYPSGDPNALASTVLANHRGDVILVAGHSNTVASLANAFGAHVSTDTIADYDNLYVVSVADQGNKVVNLQYAADSPSSPPPELTKNDGRGMTLLLVGISGGSGAQEPQQLLHAARKAGVTAIFTSAQDSPLLAPLATALNLTPATFNGADMQAFANQLISNHAQDTLVIAGKKAELQELIRQLGGFPFPVIYDSDVDHLILVTRFKSGAVRVVPMRF
jgi:2,3-bisphosphoglycerate-dependent phosphoglycerate mutase